MSIAKGSHIGSYPYRIVEELGVGDGGMSEIYLATMRQVEEPTPDDMVVLKIVNIEEQNRSFYEESLQNEVETLRRLGTVGHSGVVALYPIRGPHIATRVYTAQTQLPGQPWFFVMEHLAGGSLADLMSRQKKVEIGLAIRIALMINETLQYIHQQGFVHLDLKPENILFRKQLDQGLEPVLIDFGIARAIGQSGLEGGTLHWSPPERVAVTLTGTQPPELSPHPHPSMDVYALGMLLYNMVTGKLPFKKRSRKSTTTAILGGNATKPSAHESAVIPELDALILAMLAKEPKARPTTSQLALKLNKIAENYPFKASQLRSLKKRSKPGCFSGLAISAFGLIMLGSSGLIYSGQLDNQLNRIFQSISVSPTPIPTATQTASPTPQPTSSATPIPPTRTATATATVASATQTATLKPSSTLLPTSPARETNTPEATRRAVSATRTPRVTPTVAP
ncbi:MAG: serine/threonine protein kinase [Ardenticatenaceae bacterium]